MEKFKWTFLLILMTYFFMEIQNIPGSQIALVLSYISGCVLCVSKIIYTKD